MDKTTSELIKDNINYYTSINYLINKCIAKITSSTTKTCYNNC